MRRLKYGAVAVREKHFDAHKQSSGDLPIVEEASAKKSSCAALMHAASAIEFRLQEEPLAKG
jgi:hypothetical protein